MEKKLKTKGLILAYLSCLEIYRIGCLKTKHTQVSSDHCQKELITLPGCVSLNSKSDRSKLCLGCVNRLDVNKWPPVKQSLMCAFSLLKSQLNE